MKKIQFYSTKDDFPKEGKEYVLYFDELEQKIYTWRATENQYNYSYTLLQDPEKNNDNGFVGPHPQHPPK